MSALKKDAVQESGGVPPEHAGSPWAEEILPASAMTAAASTALDPATNFAYDASVATFGRSACVSPKM